MNKINSKINNSVNVRQLEQRLIDKSRSRESKEASQDFGRILEKISSKEEIKFSKHARERLETRKIDLRPEDYERLNSAFKKAENKGVKEALILMNDNAFIASINNKTVITAVEREALKDSVFTNIDGAVIV